MLNIPVTWVTEITHVKEQNYFVDEQRIGPYKMWHHEHHFTPVGNEVELFDRITYAMPFGPLGSLIHTLKVKGDVEQIFEYRQKKLAEIFP